MLVASLSGPTIEQTIEQLFQAQDLVDIVELRPDLYSFSNLNEIFEHCAKPIMISGGVGKSDYIDVPKDQWSDALTKQYPDAEFICSYHNFDETPANLYEILEEMQQYPAGIFKMATMAHSALDGFRMLSFVREVRRKGVKIIGHCMGETGQFTRVLGKIMGNYLTYCSVNEAVAPGQMSATVMRDIYSYHLLNEDTKIYALIGDPVRYSEGHIFHNQLFREKGVNAVYVKIPVKLEEVDAVLGEAKDLGFCGVSVTMPLKEVVAPCVCNTLNLEDDTYTNTDGTAAVALLKQKISIEGKRAIIIGWGGVGKAIAAELKNEGVELLILNRTCGGSVLGLDEWETLDLSSYHIIIQATSVGMGENHQSPVDPSRLLAHHIVLEAVSYPVITNFLESAIQKGCTIVTGRELFCEQAASQQNFWSLSYVSS